jgi:hypothetical protein
MVAVTVSTTAKTRTPRSGYHTASEANGLAQSRSKDMPLGHDKPTPALI